MKKTKKIMAAALASIMLVSLIGCGSSDEGSAETAQTNETAETSSAPDTAEIKTVEDGKLIWATNAQFEPYEFLDGNTVVGIDADIIAAIADKSGLEPVCSDMKFEAVIEAVASGEADIAAAGLSESAERADDVDFSIPYADASQVVIVRFDSPIKTANELAGCNVGVLGSSTGEKYVTENYSDTTVSSYANAAEAVDALASKDIDAVVIDNDTAVYYTDKNDDLAILDGVLTDEHYSIAVSKGNTELLNAVNSAITELEESGELDEIKAKYKAELEQDTEETTTEVETDTEETTAA